MADQPPDWFRESAPQEPKEPAAPASQPAQPAPVAPPAVPPPAPLQSSPPPAEPPFQPSPPPAPSAYPRSPTIVPAESVADVRAVLRVGESREASLRRRRLAGSVALLVLLAVGLWFLKRWVAPGYVDHLRKERAAWKDSAFIAPGEGKVDPATGETTVPYQGFGVFADSEPEGARVSVAGKVLGDTPVGAAVACAEGEPVTVRFELAGYRARQVPTRCRADAMVKLRVKLAR